MWRVIWFFLGVTRLQVTGASPEWCLQRLAKARVPFHFCGKADAFTAGIWILRRDEARVTRLVRAAGCECHVEERGGFPAIFGGLQRRLWLPVLLLAAAAAAVIVPKFVFFYTVEGNETVPSAQILRELQEAGPSGPDEAPRVGIEPMNADVTDAAYRLARLFDQPGALAVLGEGLRRELHYWLLQSVHGPAIRALGAVDSHSARIRRAVAMLRRDFMQPVSVDALADAAGMSVSVFHRHFRAMTTLSPLQFQKQLRLIHARRLMLAEGMSIAQAAGEVGYISVSQFTREYARLYGAPPGRDRRREKMSA